MHLNSQIIPSSGQICSSVDNESKCSYIRAGLFGISVNGKIFGIVATDNISSTCINNAFQKTGFSFVVNVIASKTYMAPPSISFSNKAKDLKGCQTTRTSIGSQFSVHRLQLAADQYV